MPTELPKHIVSGYERIIRENPELVMQLLHAAQTWLHTIPLSAEEHTRCFEAAVQELLIAVRNVNRYESGLPPQNEMGKAARVAVASVEVQCEVARRRPV
jgi:hypothetical protein